MQEAWAVVDMAAVHAMGAKRKHMWSRSFNGAVDPQVCVQAGCARAKSAFWLSFFTFFTIFTFSPSCIDTCHVRDGVLHPFYVASQYSTVQYSTVQYSTVQYSTVQYSTVQ
jgi:hypothetical protein